MLCAVIVSGAPGLEVDNPTRLPTFDDTGQNAMAVSGQALAGTNRQIERAVGPKDMCAVGSQQGVIRILVPGIGKTAHRDSVGSAVRVYPEFLTPGIGRLEIEAGDIPQRLQHL